MTSVGTLCHSIFKTVAQTKDDTEAGRRIHELVLKAKGDEELETLLTPTFVRQELTDDPVKQCELGRPEAASSKRTSADTLMSGLVPLKM